MKLTAKRAAGAKRPLITKMPTTPENPINVIKGSVREIRKDGPRCDVKQTGMLILVLVLVLKDSLRTFSSPCPCPGPWGSGPCPYPGPCGLGLVLVLVFSPYKDLFPLFHYSDLFA